MTIDSSLFSCLNGEWSCSHQKLPGLGGKHQLKSESTKCMTYWCHLKWKLFSEGPHGLIDSHWLHHQRLRIECEPSSDWWLHVSRRAPLPRGNWKPKPDAELHAAKTNRCFKAQHKKIYAKLWHVHASLSSVFIGGLKEQPVIENTHTINSQLEQYWDLGILKRISTEWLELLKARPSNFID